MSISPRKELANLVTATHGSPDYAELERLGLSIAEVIDFSVCTNPFGPPPAVRAALTRVAIDRYPDSEATELRHALAKTLGVSSGNILVGNGSTELIRLAALVYFSPGDNVIIIEPDFGEYEIASLLCGARIIHLPIGPQNSFRLSFEQLSKLVNEYRPKGLFLSNPHNPTGQFLSRRELEVILEVSADCLVIVDEAYISFVEDAWCSQDIIERDNLLILRSMTKDYSLAGLRLGYALANPEIISALNGAKPPWNVNALALQAGLLALEETEFIGKSLKQLRNERDTLIARLHQLGLQTVPTRANYFLVWVGNAQLFRERLLQQKIMVRDCTSFGLPEYVRLAPRRPEENDRLVSALQELNLNGLLFQP